MDRYSIRRELSRQALFRTHGIQVAPIVIGDADLMPELATSGAIRFITGNLDHYHSHYGFVAVTI